MDVPYVQNSGTCDPRIAYANIIMIRSEVHPVPMLS